ncbi:McrC family protein [Rothia nasimurium]|uniref:McrC family protein n=1 Tax=Rothia nasimurium TaxID=85336 RepID=UPI001F3AD000|nr:McrC family protein [Rothia nasimurium]
MPDNLRYFRVSGRGNGIGITVLRLVGEENPTGPTTLTLHVLPKVWSDYKKLRKEWLDEGKDRKEKDFKLLRTLPDLSTSEHEGKDTWHSYLYEMDTLQLSDEWARCLAVATPNSPEFEEDTQETELVTEVKQQNEVDDEEDGEVDPLWEEVAAPGQDHSKVELKSLEDDQAKFMWDMLSHYDQHPSRVAGHRDFPPSGMDLFPHIPAMREVFYAQFVRYAREAVRHRKPTFLPVQEELGFVRGRMVPRGLVDRKVQRRMPILCEFDALTTDSYIWQVIRAATQLAATSNNQRTLDAAVEVDAHIRDVRLIQPSTLLTSRIAANELARLSTDLKKAYFLGRAIISEQFGIGAEEPLTEGGVIANIKYTTSDLWEKIVAGYMQRSITGAKVHEQEKLYLYYANKDKKSHTGSPKKPDIVVSKEQQTVVFDAKYKFAKSSITEAGMGDQYQLTTYSYRMGCSAFLVYPQQRSAWRSLTLKENCLLLPPPGYGYVETEEDESWHRIGVLSLPFPSPGGSGFTLSEDYRSHISELLSGS